MTRIDFDHWSELATRHPERYFREREAVIRAFIDEHPPAQAQHLRELQLRIDMARATAGSPLAALRLMMRMVEDRLGALQSRLLCLQAETDKVARLVSVSRRRIN